MGRLSAIGVSVFRGEGDPDLLDSFLGESSPREGAGSSRLKGNSAFDRAYVGRIEERRSQGFFVYKLGQKSRKDDFSVEKILPVAITTFGGMILGSIIGVIAACRTGRVNYFFEGAGIGGVIGCYGGIIYPDIFE